MSSYNNHNLYITATGDSIYSYVDDLVETTSNVISNRIANTSNNLIQYTNTTSNKISTHINSLLLKTNNTIYNDTATFRTNNINTKKETIAGHDYSWDETILEPLNQLSTISQVNDMVVPLMLDNSLYRYYYFDNNQLKEARQQIITSYPNGTIPPSYVSFISYYELYKKWFGYIGWVNNESPSGLINMIAYDASQESVSNATINLSLMLQFPDDILLPTPFGNYTFTGMPVITGWYRSRRCFRILFCVRPISVNGNPVKERFIRIQYASFNHTTNSDANYPHVPANDYILPNSMTFEEYHYWSFNMSRNQFWIYMDGALVFMSPIISYFPNPANWYFGITELFVEDKNFNVSEANNNRFQFSDVYYFKRHLTVDEISNLSKYHLSSLNNPLRIYGTLEVDKIICNSIVDYNYTDKQFKKLTYEISQTSNLQNVLDGKEPLINLPIEKVVITNTSGKLATSTVSSQDLVNILSPTNSQNYNPILGFIEQQFGTQILAFVNNFAGLISLGISVITGINAILGIPYAIYVGQNAIPKAFINYTNSEFVFEDTSLTDYSVGKMRISEYFKNTYIPWIKNGNHVYNKNTGSVGIGTSSQPETNTKFQVIGGNSKLADTLTIQKTNDFLGDDIGQFVSTSKLILTAGEKDEADNDCYITATGATPDFANKLYISAINDVILRTYDTTSSTYTNKLTIANNGNITAGNITSTTLTANNVLLSDANKKISSSTITTTELGTLSGIGTTSIATHFVNTSNYVDYTCNIIMTDVNQKFVIDVSQKFTDTSNYVDYTCNIIMTDVNQKFIYSSNYTDRMSNIIMTDVNQKFIYSSNYTDRMSNIIMTDVNQKFIYSSNYTDRMSNIIMTDVNQKFMYSSNYTDRMSNIIMTDVNQKFIYSSNYTDRMSNIIMTDVNQKFIYSSNYTDRMSNIIMTDVALLSQWNKINLTNTIRIIDKDENFRFDYSTVNASVPIASFEIKPKNTSITTDSRIVLWNKLSGATNDTPFEIIRGDNGIVYFRNTANNQGFSFQMSSDNTYTTLTEKLRIDATGITANAYVVISNPNNVDEYAILNSYLNRLTKRVVFDINNQGKKVAKELISDTTYDYNENYIDYIDNVYAGHVKNDTGELYIYDRYITTYPLNTESFSVSFWFNAPYGIPEPQNGYNHICEVLRIDQDKFNSLQQDRRRLRLLVIRRNIGGVIINEIMLQANTVDGGNPTIPTADWVNLADYNRISFGNFTTPIFITVNGRIDSTYLYTDISINGVLLANHTRLRPNTEWRLENFYFHKSDYESTSFVVPYQNFRFWNVYMNYNSVISIEETLALFNFENNTIQNTLNVNGVIRATALSVEKIYLKNSLFSVPSAYNLKSLFTQEQEDGKITVQTPSVSRRSISVDNTTVNTTDNLINNSGKQGFLFYPDNQSTSLADFKTLAISDINNLQNTLDGKASSSHNHDSTYALIGHDHNGTYAPISHTHTIANVTGLSQSFIDTSNFVKITSNILQTQINNMPISGTGSQWTTNSGYINYNNIQVYPSQIRINNPSGVVIPSWVWYQFKSGLLTFDSSGNDRTLTNNGGAYVLDGGKNSILLETADDATLPTANWSTFSDLSISAWFKASALNDGDKLLEFQYETTEIRPFFNNTSSMILWLKFQNNFTDSSTFNRSVAISANTTFDNNNFKTDTHSIRFGTSSYIEYANTGGVFSPDIFTVSCWINLVTAPTSFIEFLSCRSGTGGWLVAIRNNNLEITTVASNGALTGSNVSLSSAFGGSGWRHIAIVVIKATSIMKLYIDGAIVGSTYTRTYNNNTGTSFRIGATSAQSPPIYYILNGSFMDDFRMYSVELTAQNISDLYNITQQVYNNIKLIRNNTLLSFQINNTPIYSTSSFTNNTWTHVLWNITNSSANGFVRLSTTAVGTENAYTKVVPTSGVYINKLGSITNVSTLNISDFRILTIPLTSTIKSELYSPSPAYTTLVDDAYVTNALSTLSVATDWSAITNKPQLFDGNYNSLTNKLTAGIGISLSAANAINGFDGNYNSLTNKPTASQWTSGTGLIYYNGGNVGVGNSAPFALLCVGNSAVSGSDGIIVIGKNGDGGATRHFRLGLNASYDFTIGDYGNNNSSGTWLQQFKVGWQSPANALVVSSSGVSMVGTLTVAGTISEAGSALSSKYAAASHTHSYLPLTGGTLSGTLTANHYICTKKTVSYGSQLGSTGAFLFVNEWWYTNTISYLQVSITARAFDTTVLGWWQGRATLNADGGITQFFMDRSNRIAVSNFWDATGGNYIRVADTQLVSNFATVEYKIYG